MWQLAGKSQPATQYTATIKAMDSRIRPFLKFAQRARNQLAEIWLACRLTGDAIGGNLMTIKLILAPVTGEKAETIALKTGLDLARRFEGHLRAIHIRPNAREKTSLPKDLVNSLSGKALKQVMAEADAKSLNVSKLAREMFEAFCKEQNVPSMTRPRKTPVASAGWEEKLGDPHHVISIVGRLADLIVICRPSHKIDHNTGRFIKAALFDTASPVMLVPRSEPKTIGTRIAIAWDRSAAAKRAVVSALPLLAGAETVRIISVGEPTKHGPTGKQLATYLKWHGIEAEVESERVVKDPPEQALIKAFDEFGADLVVMGAYTRSRFSQRIFGGVTRTMLNLKSMPVLFHL
ncbi:MAG: universal stress protein [Alphaproteobacteria bacterium]|nr:MAG: universal stress protein [Alphaproteobacteria bacterium]